MGRPRTTSCTDRHWPGERCQECARLRAQRSRRRRREPAAPAPGISLAGDAERALLDQQAATHRAELTKAYAKITRAIRRSAIAPPTACESCGLPAHARAARRPGQPTGRRTAPNGERSRTPQRAGPELHAWLPNPATPTAIAWLCTLCRKRIRATREPIILRWEWPGMPTTPRGRPHVKDLAGHTAAALGTIEALDWQTAACGFTELDDALFFAALTQAAGECAEALYAQGLRATLRRIPWTPLGKPELDARLQRWVAYERAQREAETTAGRPVRPVAAWERRARRDRLPPPTPQTTAAPARPPQPFDEDTALERLAAAEASYAATLARIAATLEHGKRHEKGTPT